jgi:hypothetical protein
MFERRSAALQQAAESKPQAQQRNVADDREPNRLNSNALKVEHAASPAVGEARKEQLPTLEERLARYRERADAIEQRQAQSQETGRDQGRDGDVER